MALKIIFRKQAQGICVKTVHVRVEMTSNEKHTEDRR